MRSIACALGICIAIVYACIGIVAGPCLIWLVDDVPSRFYAVNGTLLNHTTCDEALVRGWFAVDIDAQNASALPFLPAAQMVVVQADYSWDLCSTMRFQMPDCCEKYIGVVDHFWIGLLKNDGGEDDNEKDGGEHDDETIGYGVSLSQPTFAPESEHDWRFFGWLVFGSTLIDIGVLLVLLLSCVVGEYRHRHRGYLAVGEK